MADRDIAKVAAGLTKAQKRALLTLTPGNYMFWGDAMKQRRTRMWLVNNGLIEPERKHGGVITVFASIRLTPLGIAVRALLVEQSNSCPSCGGLNTSCPEGCGRDPVTGELDGSTLLSGRTAMADLTMREITAAGIGIEVGLAYSAAVHGYWGEVALFLFCAAVLALLFHFAMPKEQGND